MADHHLTASVDTCHWGYFASDIAPTLTVDSGDRVTIDTLSGNPTVVPDPDEFMVFPELAEKYAETTRSELPCFNLSRRNSEA